MAVRLAVVGRENVPRAEALGVMHASVLRDSKEVVSRGEVI